MTDHPERCSLGARERQSSFQLGLQDPVFSGQILIPAGAAPGPPYGKLFARLGSFDHLVFTAGKTLQLGSLATYRWCPAGITARLFYRFNILATRATVRYLPQYSPDLNPIELPYSKFKAFLRKVAARTVRALHRAIRSFIPMLDPQECANYFKHAGYASK